MIWNCLHFMFHYLVLLSGFNTTVQPEQAIANCSAAKNLCQRLVNIKFKAHPLVKQQEKARAGPKNTHGKVIYRPDLCLMPLLFLFYIHKAFIQKSGTSKIGIFWKDSVNQGECLGEGFSLGPSTSA